MYLLLLNYLFLFLAKQQLIVFFRGRHSPFLRNKLPLVHSMFPVLKEKGCRRLTIGGQISKAYPLFGRDLEQTLADLQLDGISPAANPDDAHLLGCAYVLADGSREAREAASGA